MSTSIENGLKENRAENSARSMAARLVCTVIVVIGPFILRTLMIRYLGMELLGLHSVFQTILNVLSISEMGIGQVMVYFLFEPLALGQTSRVNAILNHLRKVYHIIGLIMLGAGLVIMIVLPAFIHDTSIDANLIRVYFAEYLVGTLLQYFVFLEDTSLLNALQRLDIQYIITIIANLIGITLQIVAIVVFKNYQLYLIVMMLQAVGKGIGFKVVTERGFPQFEPKGDITREDAEDIKKQVFSMVGHQIDEKLLNSIDSLFITFFIGLTAVAVYGNYFYVVTAVAMFIDILFSSVLSAIGNAIVMEDRESNHFRFECMLWISSLIVGVSTICMYSGYQDFMRVWAGKHMLEDSAMIIFCIYFYFSQIRKCVLLFKNAAGMWYNDRYKPYISMGLDIILDLILIRKLGISGAVISSVICVCLVEIPWETKVLFRDYFQIRPFAYYLELLKYTILNFGILMVVKVISDLIITGIPLLDFGIKMVCGVLIPVLVYYVLFRKNRIFIQWMGLVKRVVRGYKKKT